MLDPTVKVGGVAAAGGSSGVTEYGAAHAVQLSSAGVSGRWACVGQRPWPGIVRRVHATLLTKNLLQGKWAELARASDPAIPMPSSTMREWVEESSLLVLGRRTGFK